MAEPTVVRSELAAGDVTLHVEELRGAADGPTVTLLGGVHGDEPEGVLAVRRVLGRLRTMELRGTLRAVAVANPLAHAADARETPQDGENLARVFPGAADRGPTAAIARALATEVIAGSDLLVDLHSAGRRYAMPLFCGYLSGDDRAAQRSRACARAFGLDLVWAHDEVAPGRTVSLAHELAIPAVYVEASGGGEVRGRELDRIVAGTLSVCAVAGLIDGEHGISTPPEQRVIRGGDGDIDGGLVAPGDAIMVTRTRASATVDPGDTIADFHDDDGALIESMIAPRPGTVMMLRREARVRRDDLVAVVAPGAESW